MLLPCPKMSRAYSAKQQGNVGDTKNSWTLAGATGRDLPNLRRRGFPLVVNRRFYALQNHQESEKESYMARIITALALEKKRHRIH